MKRIVNWLRNLLKPSPKQVQAQKELTPITEADIETHEGFLLQLLRTTAESNGDAQVIYPLLAANTDKLDHIFAELLQRWATNTLAEAEPDTAESIAYLMVILGNRISNFPLGSKADNMEIAIAAYNASLEVYTRSAFPQDWAMTQNNLGIAYLYRILGERAENLELAIAAYNASLEVRARSAFPQQWAMTQNNLGTAYLYRILGERAENLELAIAAYNASLEVYTRSAFPQDWAMTQNNLGAAYSDRILGERAENLELAIAAYNASLEVYTRSAFPQDWAMTQNNLGIAYRNRILGERAENLELAIAAYNASLEVYTRSAFPQQWAMTQNNLGAAYNNRILGERAENLELAIAAFNASRSVYTRSAFPQDWAMTQNNLGTAYLYRILGERAENLELAIAAFNASRSVYTRSAFPQDWAMTQNNLGIAYNNRILGERAENLEIAIAAYNASLEVYTRSAFPQENAKTLENLGMLYQDATQQFELAYNTFAEAITTVESLRGGTNSGEEAKRKQGEEWNRLYRRMVEVCLALSRNTAAIEYIERNKTRNLVELIFQGDVTTIFPPEVVTELEQLNHKIATNQYELQNNKSANTTALDQDIKAWRQQRQELQDSYLPVGSSFKFEQFQQTLDANTAIIEWHLTANHILAFIIKPNGQELTSWQSSPEDLQALFDWGNAYLRDYYNPEDTEKIQWQNQLETRLQELAKILHLEEIIAQLPPECERLILIPHRFLHLFPLHALPVNNSHLMDLFPQGVGYAPSCQILQQVNLRQRDDFQSLFAIQNPTEDLYKYYEWDLGAVAAIKQNFAHTSILKQDRATKSAIINIQENNHITLNQELQTANCLFFFCHGYFNSNSPGDSGLQLADDNLTLTDIITHFKLPNCRLVTLSACESGMIDFNNTNDEYEYIGLPSGFLLAGSTNVVSSLWTVSATATALLMMKFYQDLNQPSQHQSNIILALNTAQRWLRDTTVEGFQIWLGNSSLSLVWQAYINQYFIDNYIDKYHDATIKPFASPFYWSAFSAIGKGV